MIDIRIHQMSGNEKILFDLRGYCGWVGKKAHPTALGATDFIRFMQQFNQGHGNYVEDRPEWQQNYSVNDILAEIENSK